MSDTKDNVELSVKRPKRILHFSDGVVEEYDTDDDGNRQNDATNERDKQIVLHNWPTVSSAVNNVIWFGSKTLQVCDYVGEGLANFFGITSPKYEYEIEEFKRRQEEEIRSETKMRDEFAGWTQSVANQTTINMSDIKSEIKQNDCDLQEKQRF